MRLDVRRGAAATALLLTLGSTAACGNGGGTPGAASSTSPSTAAAATLTRANFASAMTDAIQTKHSAHLQLAIGKAVSAVGDVAYDGTTPTMQLALTFSGQQAELRFVNGTAYLSVPGLTPAGKFLEVKPGNAMMGSLVQQLKNFGPNGAITLLRSAVKDFRDTGTTTIDGQQVRHYRVTVDPAALLRQMKLPTGVPTTSLPKSITEDLYVGAGNLMRRVVLDAAGQKVTIDTTKWGEPVHVTAPPPSKVIKSPTGMGGGIFSGNRAPSA